VEDISRQHSGCDMVMAACFLTKFTMRIVSKKQSGKVRKTFNLLRKKKCIKLGLRKVGLLKKLGSLKRNQWYLKNKNKRKK
jgi:hypothetical protein